jgi:PAB-dependent poly(A)-specific ribonuclease subunit 2
LLLPPPGPQALPTPIQTLAFDSSQELLWTGNEFGRVSSFYGTELQRYTSFKGGDGPIRQILVHDKGIIALASRSVHMAVRRGAPLWHITYVPWILRIWNKPNKSLCRHDEMKDLRCMSYTSKGNSEVLVAGLQDQMFTIDVEKGTITKQVRISYVYKALY